MGGVQGINLRAIKGVAVRVDVREWDALDVANYIVRTSGMHVDRNRTSNCVRIDRSMEFINPLVDLHNLAIQSSFMLISGSFNAVEAVSDFPPRS